MNKCPLNVRIKNARGKMLYIMYFCVCNIKKQLIYKSPQPHIGKMKWCDVFTCISPYDSISGVAYRPLTERTIKTEHISFPPGRPNSSNIEPICAWHMYRPRYLNNCLPRTGFDWLAHQVKAINGLEKSFRQCCKKNKDVHACAEGKACIFILGCLQGDSYENCLNRSINILALIQLLYERRCESS